MAHQHQPKKQTRALFFYGGEFDDLMPVANINSPPLESHILLLHGKLKNGEVYYIVSFLTHSGKPLVTCKTSDNRKLRTRRMKIALTKEQLDLLLSGSMKIQCRIRVSKFRKSSGLQKRTKWQPALPTIPELQDY